MPVVPYKPFPDQSPADIPTPGVRISTPEAAFGIGVAHAIGQIGQTGEQVGNELFSRAIALQQMQNYSDAAKGKSDFIQQAGELHAQFLNKEGLNAGPEALKKHSEDLNNLREQIRASLPNDMVRREYDAESLGFMARNVYSAGTHSATQMKQYHKLANNLDFEADLRDLALHPTDPTAIEKAKQGAAKSAKIQASLEGLGPKEEEQLRLDKESKAFATKYSNMARDYPHTALDEIQEHKEELGDRYDKVLGTVLTAAQDHIADKVSKAVNGDLHTTDASDEPLESRMRRALDVLEKQHKDIPEYDHLVKRTENAVRRDYNMWKAEHKDGQDHYMGQIVDSIIKNNPRDLEHLKSDPQARAAYDALDPKNQFDVPNKIQRYHDALLKSTSQDTLHRLMGIRQDGTLQEFLAIDPTKEALSQSDVKKIWAEQAKARQNGEKDPQVQRAITILDRGKILSNAGLTRDKDDPRWQTFVGALQDALVEHQRGKGKAPTLEEVEEIGKTLTKGYVYHYFTSNEPGIFEKDRNKPAKEIDDLRLKLMEQFPGKTITEEDVYRELARIRFREAYESKQKNANPSK